MKFRRATLKDCALLAELNHQLIRRGTRNRMTVAELEQRMKGWLASEYAAVLFENSGEVVASSERTYVGGAICISEKELSELNKGYDGFTLMIVTE